MPRAGEYSIVILSSFPVSRRHRLDTRTKINLRHQQPSYIDANQSCPIPDSDFAAILGRASGLLFLSSNDADYFGKKVRRDEFRDCTHILGLFCFSPRSVSLRGDERPYRRSRASCRAGADADTVAVIKPALSVERIRVTCPLPDIWLASPAAPLLENAPLRGFRNDDLLPSTRPRALAQRGLGGG